jgi:hypothetical protein
MSFEEAVNRVGFEHFAELTGKTEGEARVLDRQLGKKINVVEDLRKRIFARGGNQQLLIHLKYPVLREDKVASIRAQIEAGTYESPNKVDIAVDRLLDDLAA